MSSTSGSSGASFRAFWMSLGVGRTARIPGSTASGRRKPGRPWGSSRPSPGSCRRRLRSGAARSAQPRQPIVAGDPPRVMLERLDEPFLGLLVIGSVRGHIGPAGPPAPPARRPPVGPANPWELSRAGSSGGAGRRCTVPAPGRGRRTGARASSRPGLYRRACSWTRKTRSRRRRSESR